MFHDDNKFNVLHTANAQTIIYVCADDIMLTTNNSVCTKTYWQHTKSLLIYVQCIWLHAATHGHVYIMIGYFFVLVAAWLHGCHSR